MAPARSPPSAFSITMYVCMCVYDVCVCVCMCVCVYVCVYVCMCVRVYDRLIGVVSVVRVRVR
jgi:hypothetical protein